SSGVWYQVQTNGRVTATFDVSIASTTQTAGYVVSFDIPIGLLPSNPSVFNNVVIGQAQCTQYNPNVSGKILINPVADVAYTGSVKGVYAGGSSYYVRVTLHFVNQPWLVGTQGSFAVTGKFT